MHAALDANISGGNSAIWSSAALHAITPHLREHRVMILCQCASTRGAVSTAQWPAISWQAVHEFTGQLHAEGQVRLVGVLRLPQPERVENADVDEPPYQACPTLTTLPSWQIGVVQLIDHIDSTGVMEVVADCLRAAELIDEAIVAPALQCSELIRINVIVEQQDELLVAPGTESDVASLHL